MANLLDELKERNLLKLILIVRFTCATLDVGHPIVPGNHIFRIYLSGFHVSRMDQVSEVISPGGSDQGSIEGQNVLHAYAISECAEFVFGFVPRS
jgi:hypothetical protein